MAAEGKGVMNLTSSRHKTGQSTVPSQPSRPHYSTTEINGRTDLFCSSCGQRIAYGVQPARLDSDVAFFFEAHAPFCQGGAHPGS